MSRKIPVSSIVLNWVCPEPDCEETFSTSLKWIEENGTVTCTCGADCVLADDVDVEEKEE